MRLRLLDQTPLTHYFLYMRFTLILKPLLLMYEVVRIIIIANLLIYMSNDQSFFVLMIFAVQGAVFPIMALFLCLNAVRYREYIPLYIAGKIIGILAILCWSLLTQQATMIGGFIREMTLICFDLFTVTALMVIKNDVKSLMSEPAPGKDIIETEEN